MSKLFILGLTGPSGAGKTLASSVLVSLGFETVNADKKARMVTQPGSPCLRELADAFGREIIKPDGSLDRKALAKQAFGDPTKLTRLNAITHPHVLRLIAERLETLQNSGARYALLDAPALYQSGADRFCDKVLAVTAPKEACLARILTRDGLTTEEAERRLGAVPIEYFTQKADYVICNDGSPASFVKALEALAGKIKNEAEGIHQP